MISINTSKLRKRKYSGRFLVDLNNSRRSSLKIPKISQKYYNSSYTSIGVLVSNLNSDLRKSIRSYSDLYKNHSNMPVIRINGEFRSSEFLDIMYNKKVFFDIKDGDVLTNITKEDIETVFDVKIPIDITLPEFSYTYRTTSNVPKETFGQILYKHNMQNFEKLDILIKLIEGSCNKKVSLTDVLGNKDNIKWFIRNNVNTSFIEDIYNHFSTTDSTTIPTVILDNCISFHTLNKFITEFLNMFYVR